MKPRTLIVGLVLALIALSTPLYQVFGGPVEPYLFGLPFFFGWTVIVLTCVFLLMVVFHLTRAAEQE